LVYSTDLKISLIKRIVFRGKNENGRNNILLAGLVAALLLSSTFLTAQETKRIDKVKAFFADEVHSPKKAVVYSAILPGWGQAYNRKYWKMPIVYVGFGAVGYFIKTNHDQYKLFKNDYLLLLDDPGAETSSGLSQQQIRTRIDIFRRNRDLSIIGLFAWYGLGLVDASVDGHFFNYDIDDDLTLKLEPRVFDTYGHNQGLGISLNFTWK